MFCAFNDINKLDNKACTLLQLRSFPSPYDEQALGNFDRHSGLLLRISVTGTDQTSTTLETSLPTRESFVQDFRSLSQDQVAGRFVIEAGPGTQLNRMTFQSETDFRYVYYIRYRRH